MGSGAGPGSGSHGFTLTRRLKAASLGITPGSVPHAAAIFGQANAVQPCDSAGHIIPVRAKQYAGRLSEDGRIGIDRIPRRGVEMIGVGAYYASFAFQATTTWVSHFQK